MTFRVDLVLLIILPHKVYVNNISVYHFNKLFSIFKIMMKQIGKIRHLIGITTTENRLTVEGRSHHSDPLSLSIMVFKKQN